MSSETKTVEQLSALTRLEWLENRHILAVKNEDSTREGIDRVSARLVEIASEQAGKPILILVDATHDVAMTPYARAKLKETFDTFKHLEGRTAMLIQKTVFGHIVRLFMRTQKSVIRERRIFFDRDEALNWLKESLG